MSNEEVAANRYVHKLITKELLEKAINIHKHIIETYDDGYEFNCSKEYSHLVIKLCEERLKTL